MNSFFVWDPREFEYMVEFEMFTQYSKQIVVINL